MRRVDQNGTRIPTLVGSLLIHASVVGALVIVSPERRDRSVAQAPSVEVVTVEPPPVVVTVPPGSGAPALPPRRSLGAQAGRRDLARPRKGVEPDDAQPPRIDDEVAGGLGTGEAGSGAGGGSGDGDGDGDGAGGDHDGRGHGSTSKPTTMPVPLGPRRARMPYTRAALEARVSGDVLVGLTVDPAGVVSAAHLVRGLGHGLDEIALRLAASLRFLPARDHEQRAVAAQITWRFHFSPSAFDIPPQESM